jgi:hypothetical protein
MSKRAWEIVVDKIIGGVSDAWKKLGKPTVGRGKTQWPKKTSEQESQGVRFDYDGESRKVFKSTTSGKSSQTQEKSPAPGRSGVIGTEAHTP